MDRQDKIKIDAL